MQHTDCTAWPLQRLVLHQQQHLPHTSRRWQSHASTGARLIGLIYCRTETSYGRMMLKSLNTDKDINNILIDNTYYLLPAHKHSNYMTNVACKQTGLYWDGMVQKLRKEDHHKMHIWVMKVLIQDSSTVGCFKWSQYSGRKKFSFQQYDERKIPFSSS